MNTKTPGLKRYRPNWDYQKMVYDPFGLWARWEAAKLVQAENRKYRDGIDSLLRYVRVNKSKAVQDHITAAAVLSQMEKELSDLLERKVTP